MRTKLAEAKACIELPGAQNVCSDARNDVGEQDRYRQNQEYKIMAMVVPCPPQPIAERHQDCWRAPVDAQPEMESCRNCRPCDAHRAWPDPPALCFDGIAGTGEVTYVRVLDGMASSKSKEVSALYLEMRNRRASALLSLQHAPRYTGSR